MIPAGTLPDLRVVTALVDDADMRYQDPAIERQGTRRLYFQIRPVMPIVVDGRIERRRQTIRLGFCDEMTLPQAKLKKQSVMATINGGDVVLQAQLPLSALIERFKAARLPALASTTRAKYGSHLSKHIEPGLGHLRLGEVDKPTIEAWLMSKATLSHATRLDLRHILAALFRCAAEWRMWTGPNPAHRAIVGRGGPVRRFAKPSVEETCLFLDSIRDTRIMPAWRARQIAELCLLAGLRVSEALGLEWRDVDAVDQTVRIERRYARGDWDVPKSLASARVQKVGALAAEILFQRPQGAQDDAPVFTRADGSMPDDRDLQQHVWKPAAVLAGVYHQGFGLHSLRRLSITWRQECGATPIEAMRQGGHRKLDMTLLYTMDDSGREAAVVDKMRKRLQ